MQKYAKAIKERVCAICVDSDENGNCTLSNKETCSVQAFLPQIVDIIHNSGTDDIQIYKEKVHETICSNCRTQESGGYCHLREDVNCSVDRYFRYIVETIQQVDEGII